MKVFWEHIDRRTPPVIADHRDRDFVNQALLLALSKLNIIRDEEARAMPKQWQNKIVGHAEVDPKTLAANDRNWRLHLPAQRAAVQGNLEDIGIIKSILVNQRTGRLIDGHLRLDLALTTGQKTVPVEYVDLTEQEEAQALATLDPSAALATTDQAKLGSLLEDLKSPAGAVQKMLDDLAAKSGLPADAEEREIEELQIKAPPKMVWLLIGVPLDRFGEVQGHVAGLQEVAGVSVQSNRGE
jgi:hypothetical protein